MRPTARLALTSSALAALLAAAAPAARADDLPATSRIASVTVYPDRALVERTATVTVPAGTSRISFSGLPAGFDVGSLRARSSQVTILGVDSERVPLAREASPQADAARREWDRLRRETQAADLDLQDAKDAWERLRSIRATAVARAGEAVGGASFDPANVAKMLALVDEQGAAARKRIVAAESALEAARAAEDAARRRFEQISADAGREEIRAVVTVSAPASGDAALSLQYLVGNAGWRPVYDLRVADDFSAVALEMNATVAQRTGEDWSGVAMELTTAQPSTGAAPPEPQAWTIDLLREPGRSKGFGGGAPPAAAAKSRADDDREETKDAAFVAPVRRSGVVVAFRTALPANVASDGQPSRVAVGRFDLAPQVRWTAFPRATDKVFVTAKLKNAAGTALPAGEGRVFVGPDYVGPLALPDWAQEKEIDVGLGVDREVEVARETLKHERSTEGVFTKDTVHERAYRVTLKNHRGRAIDVRLLDQVPVSRDEELKVEVTETSLPLATLPPREAEDAKARGILEWRCGMGPRSETDVRFAFRVEYPKARTVLGMDD